MGGVNFYYNITTLKHFFVNMDSLGNLMNKRLGKTNLLVKQATAGLVVEFASSKIREFWGIKSAEMARVISLKRQILTISCVNPIIAQEIKFKHNKFINAINEKFGKDTVKKLKIVQKGVELPVVWC